MSHNRVCLGLHAKVTKSYRKIFHHLRKLLDTVGLDSFGNSGRFVWFQQTSRGGFAVEHVICVCQSRYASLPRCSIIAAPHQRGVARAVMSNVLLFDLGEHISYYVVSMPAAASDTFPVAIEGVVYKLVQKPEHHEIAGRLGGKLFIVGIGRSRPDNVVERVYFVCPIQVERVGQVGRRFRFSVPVQYSGGHISGRIADIVVVAVNGAALPDGKAAVIIHRKCCVYRLVVMDQNAGEREIDRGIAFAELAALDHDACSECSFNDVSGDLSGNRKLDINCLHRRLHIPFVPHPRIVDTVSKHLDMAQSFVLSVIASHLNACLPNVYKLAIGNGDIVGPFRFRVNTPVIEFVPYPVLPDIGKIAVFDPYVFHIVFEHDTRACLKAKRKPADYHIGCILDIYALGK